MTQAQKVKNLRREAKRIASVLSKSYRPEKIILFGSSVSGRVDEWSDLDMVIIKKTDKRFYDRVSDVMMLADSEEPIDFLVYTPEEFENMARWNYFIRDEVLGKGETLYVKSG